MAALLPFLAMEKAVKYLDPTRQRHECTRVSVFYYCCLAYILVLNKKEIAKKDAGRTTSIRSYVAHEGSCPNVTPNEETPAELPSPSQPLSRLSILLKQ